ncbi:MAG: hypothetical protein ABIN55_11060, partial [Aeromicrobium sp.]
KDDAEAAADDARAAPAGDKEEAAWANVGAVNTDDAPAKEPEEAPAEKVTHVPDETEPVEEDAREEEAEAADSEPKDEAKDAEATNEVKRDIPAGEIIAVEDAPSTSDPVSEDAAPLSDANPSGEDLSKAATEAVDDGEIRAQASDGDAVEEGSTQKGEDNETKP